MLNFNALECRKAVTVAFATMLLVSMVIGQETRTGNAELEGKLHSQTSRNSLLAVDQPSVMMPELTITPITWGVIGLDSNNVNDGPNLFPVGARVCNTGTTTATNVVSTFMWDSANAFVELRTGSLATITLPTLNAGACTDSYFEVQITRNAAARDTTRAFHIEATADTLGVVSTPPNRELYVERLVSQNRNSVDSIFLNGVNVPLSGTMNLTVGNTYTIRLNASTATNGYEQIESFINLPNVIFQTLGVVTTYTAPSSITRSTLYEDACGWDPVVGSATYRSCPTSNDKAGGTVSITYTVKILSGAGTSRTLNTLIYDYSGSSYHYNSDFSSDFVTANIVLPPSASNAGVSGRLLTADGSGIRNAVLYLTEEDGTVHTARSSTFGYYRFEDIPVGQSVVVMVASKRYTFLPNTQVVSLTDEIVDMDWVAID